MMPISMSGRSRVILGAVLIAVVFLALRLPGITLPYHQDEWKNVASSATVEGAGTFFAHPPLMQIMFVAANSIFGPEYFRLFPLIFSVGSAVLLYFVAKKRGGKNAAVWATILYSACIYCILGSLQTDVDGSILPFFFLLAVYSYDRLPGRKWSILLTFSLLAGMLIKLNFILVIGAIVLDYIWQNRRSHVTKKIGGAAGELVVLGIIYVALLYLIQAVYPAFSISFMMGHANQFSDDGGRNWTQIAVQGIKALYYLSPLMLAPLLWLSKEIIRKTRVFGLYLVVGFIFYFILFDFSRGALDKYLMFSIVPLSIIVGQIFSDVFERRKEKHKERRVMATDVFIGIALSIGVFALNFLPQIVVGLYPKTEWFSNVLHGHWNILTPFTGGSGPIGFYISFLFMAVSFIGAIIAAVAGKFSKKLTVSAAVVILFVGVTYNLVFAEELFHGKINGSAPEVLQQVSAFIRKSEQITEVLTYNDIGAGPLSQMGKYAGRIYATPDSEEGYRDKFAKFDGYYMIVDVPHLYETGFYAQFFATCRSLFSYQSGRISGNVYECPRQ